MEHAVNAFRAIGSIPFRADGKRVAVRGDAAVGSGENSRGRIKEAGQLVERHIADPLVSVVRSGNRKAAVSGSANGNAAAGLVSDVPVHIRVNHILAGSDKVGERAAKFIPILRGIQVEEN